MFERTPPRLYLPERIALGVVRLALDVVQAYELRRAPRRPTSGA
jgi:hypothetical protein